MLTSLLAIVTYAYEGLEESLLGTVPPRLRLQGLTNSRRTLPVLDAAMLEPATRCVVNCRCLGPVVSHRQAVPHCRIHDMIRFNSMAAHGRSVSVID